MPTTPAAPLKRRGVLELDYIYGAVVAYEAGEILKPRVLKDFELVLVIEGHVTYSHDGTDSAAPPGTVILARPGFKEMYQWDPKGDTRHAYLHFDIKAIPRDWPVANRWPIIFAHPDPVVVSLFHHLVATCAAHPNWPSQPPTRSVCRMTEALVGTLLQRTAEQTGEIQSRPAAVERAMQLMRQQLDESPSDSLCLDDLAITASVSPKHLCHLFRRTLGCTPMRAWRLLRIQLALILLSRSNLSIKQIANRCGFSDQFQFSHCFSQVLAQSPSQARESMRDGKPMPVVPLPADLTPRVFW